ncbi:MAG: TlpA disulfide reductase family protein [Mariprofundaceae bacterium]|nr:TlpA disulfide reductase family protein [Mariprofundaceae bacterium]
MSAWLKKHPEVSILPVSLDSDLETAQAFLKSHNIDLPALLTDQEQAGHLGIRGLPTTILINKQGQMIDRRVGMQDWSYPAWSNEVLALFSDTIDKK